MSENYYFFGSAFGVEASQESSLSALLLKNVLFPEKMEGGVYLTGYVLHFSDRSQWFLSDIGEDDIARFSVSMTELLGEISLMTLLVDAKKHRTSTDTWEANWYTISPSQRLIEQFGRPLDMNFREDSWQVHSDYERELEACIGRGEGIKYEEAGGWFRPPAGTETFSERLRDIHSTILRSGAYTLVDFHGQNMVKTVTKNETRQSALSEKELEQLIASTGIHPG